MSKKISYKEMLKNQPLTKFAGTKELCIENTVPETREAKKRRQCDEKNVRQQPLWIYNPVGG